MLAYIVTQVRILNSMNRKRSSVKKDKKEMAVCTSNKIGKKKLVQYIDGLYYLTAIVNVNYLKCIRVPLIIMYTLHSLSQNTDHILCLNFQE